jgi:tetratricopeptide (TPR) repeat protein
MPENKKTAAAKSVDRRMKPQVSKASKSGPSEAPQAGAVSPSARQRENFESAMRLFHERKLKLARDLFQQATEGPERDVAQRARLHAVMCERRVEQETVTLRSAEDYYNYGVVLINTRRLMEARSTLEKALELAPGKDHIHYALALAQALGGDPQSAYANLKHAIELEPRNRLLARQDADFAPLANQPPFDALLYPERQQWQSPEKKGW